MKQSLFQTFWQAAVDLMADIFRYVTQGLILSARKSIFTVFVKPTRRSAFTSTRTSLSV